ncbi:UPF0764 protein C16orf89 homolog [Diabrotica virgifera virgifera]|uniref:UPF0764 protein C16orf89 homolog n=1 Tax=Diabrotica virgifera virgifera TaxID=50390 RepID=A0A6P7FYW6_DIAVI|nr:UPF0764 protein C16orf89 homolog [Diabrotica virgifera virgifera]
MYLLLIVGLVLFANGTNGLLGDVKEALDNVLNFVNQRMDQFGFDGYFGIVLAQTQLQMILELQIKFDDIKDIKYFIQKCQSILNKAKFFLPLNPPYMILFETKLLDSHKWFRSLIKNVTFGEITNLGQYMEWSPERILKNKRAIYKGVETNFCLREILELTTGDTCYVSTICKDMMTNTSRMDTGYLLTHRLLYIQIKRLEGCIVPEDPVPIKEYTRLFCSYILKEAKTNEYLKFPYHDIFMEQVLLCGMEGFAEFLNKPWLETIIKWQNPQGCFESVSKEFQNIQKRSSHLVDFGCSDHSTGLGAAVLALFLKCLFLQ